MKSHIFRTLLFFFSISLSSLAQDIITQKNLKTIEAKIIEISPKEVKYKRFDNPEGPVIIISKSDLVSIKYQNGTIEKIEENEGWVMIEKPLLPANTDMFLKGKIDAKNNYDGQKSGSTATLITSILSPLIAIIPAIATSATYPKDFNLDYPNVEYMKNPQYARGYNHKAKKIKQGKIWRNWGIGLAVNIIYQLAIVNQN